MSFVIHLRARINDLVAQFVNTFVDEAALMRNTALQRTTVCDMVHATDHVCMNGLTCDRGGERIRLCSEASSTHVILRCTLALRTVRFRRSRECRRHKLQSYPSVTVPASSTSCLRRCHRTAVTFLVSRCRTPSRSHRFVVRQGPATMSLKISTVGIQSS